MRQFIITLFVVIIGSSCTRLESNDFSFDLPQANTEFISTNNNVSLDDVFSVIERKCAVTKGQNKLRYSVQPYVDSDSDTLFYIVNFADNSGWKIYSSDRRTPAVIAEGFEGYFSLEEGNPTVAFWMANVASDMKRVRSASNSELSFTDEDIIANRSFWSAEPQLLKIAPDYPTGHWEEVIYTDTIVADTLDHMVPKWDQEEPYNTLSPFYSDGETRACAGCVAIAGAQVLYYLHNKLGVPERMYSDGYCVGAIDNYSRWFENYTDNVWPNMSMAYQSPYETESAPESVMIGYVGHCVGMHYCDNIFDRYSWAWPRRLKSDLFEPLGISCLRGDYDEDIVKESLLNEMPIIVSASDQYIPTNGRIHCFVIDGYRRTKLKHTHHHYFVIDAPSTTPHLMPEEYDTYTYSSPQITSIKINWGWASQWGQAHVNDGWFSLTAGWTVTNNGTYNYDNHIKIIYNFAIAESTE